MNADMRFSLGLGFASSCAAVAISPPLDRLADASFAWHMVQHEMLLFAVPLGLVVSEPFIILRRYAPMAWTVRLLRLTHAFRKAFSPVVGLAAFVIVLWGVHFSPLYEWALRNESLHVAEHVLLIAAGVLFWIPVVGMRPISPLAYPLRLLYLAIALPQGALPAIAIAGTRAPLYPTYASAEAVNALGDQHNAAAILWIGGGSIVFVALLTTLGAWAAREQRRSPAFDAEL